MCLGLHVPLLITQATYCFNPCRDKNGTWSFLAKGEINSHRFIGWGDPYEDVALALALWDHAKTLPCWEFLVKTVELSPRTASSSYWPFKMELASSYRSFKTHISVLAWLGVPISSMLEVWGARRSWRKEWLSLSLPGFLHSIMRKSHSCFSLEPGFISGLGIYPQNCIVAASSM